jgi:hypothetical protein
MAGTTRLVVRQNGRRAIVLHRAIAVVHRRAQRAHIASLAASALIAVLGVGSRLAPATAPTIVIIGAAWAVVYAAVVVPWAARYQRTAATLQEMLESELFDLPMNRIAIGEPVTEHEVSELGRRFRGDEDSFRTYFLVAAVPAPYDVLFCLEQNLGWGSRIRLRYARILLSVAVAWSVVGLLVGVVAKLGIVTLIGTWFVPSLGLLLVCLDNYRAQSANARERKRVLSLVIAAGEDPATRPITDGPAWITFARQVQDVLFHTRTQQPRTPTWFFQRWHDEDQADFEYRKERLEERVNSALRPDPAT